MSAGENVDWRLHPHSNELSVLCASAELHRRAELRIAADAPTTDFGEHVDVGMASCEAAAIAGAVPLQGCGAPRTSRRFRVQEVRDERSPDPLLHATKESVKSMLSAPVQVIVPEMVADPSRPNEPRESR